MKKFHSFILWVLLSLFILSLGIGRAGETDTRELWKKVNQAEKNGLPKTAISNLKQIYSVTLRHKQYGEALRAIVQQIVLESIIKGNKPEEKVNRLKQVIQKAPREMKYLMKAVLSQWYWHYYSRNRWRFMKRSATAGLDEKDFTTWDLPRLFNEISDLYQDILKAEKKLKSIPVNKFYKFLNQGTVAPDLRPTLFDFVAFEALRFYSSGEQTIASPRDAFEIRADEEALARAEKFITTRIETNDPESPKYRSLRLYQKLMVFHHWDKNKDAFIDADIHRLRYVRNVAVGEAVTDRYIKRLQEIISTYPDSRLSSLARYYQARELKTRNKLAEAFKIASQGHARFPDSRGGQNCRALMSRIQRKEFKLKTEKVIQPEKSSRLVLEYKNIRTLSFRIHKDSLKDTLRGLRGRRFDRLPEKVVKTMLSEKPVAQWTVDLKPTNDFQNRKVFVTIPPLEPGFYRIFASHKKDFSYEGNKIQNSPVWVSRVGLILRTRAKILEGYITNSISGKPAGDATISLYKYNYQTKTYLFRQTRHIDKSGYFRITQEGDYHPSNSLVTVSSPTLGFYADSGVPPRYHYPDKREFKTIFFTDRSLYRPGQMVFFKGICLDVDKKANNYKCIPNKALSVSFRDANNQEIARQRVVSNDFGSFSGTFIAPRDRLTGRMTLAADSPPGNTTIRVEEYKRPKFQVNLKLPEKEFRLNDKVVVCGQARAYTGAPIDHARVSYRVVREVRYPYWWYFWYGRGHGSEAREIINGTLRTDKTGKFCIPFFARPDLSISKSAQPIFTFKLQAEVTDTTGETRSDETRLRLGYTSMEASLRTPDWLEEHRPVPMTITTTTLNNKRIAAAGTVEIFQLRGPENPVPGNMIGELDILAQPEGSGNDAGTFSNTPDWKKWPSGKRVLQKSFKTRLPDGAPWVLKLKLKKGMYRARLKSKDKFGNPVEAYHHFVVLKRDDKHFMAKLPFYFIVKKNSLSVGETFEALWGTGYKRGPVRIEIFKDNKWLKKSWTRPDQTQGLIRIPIDEKFRGGFTVVTTFVKQNRLYQTITRVYVPWTNKQLRIQWQTFRSKLQPGQKETWSLKIRGPDSEMRAAEMVATLYDVSLDQYYPHYFPNFSNLFKSDNTIIRLKFSNRGLNFSSAVDRLNTYFAYSPASYVHFPREVRESLFGYQYGSKRYAIEQRASRTEESGEVLGEALLLPAVAKGGLNGRVDAITKDKKRNGDEGRGRKKIDLSKVKARKNLNETAFFYPHLKTAGDGSVTIEFKMPEALTEWRFMGFAHTRDLEYGSIEGRTVTQKELMVQPNPPRFLREGDVLGFTVKVTNMTDQMANGSLQLLFTDPVNESSLDARLKNIQKEQPFSIPPRESRTCSFQISVPDNLDIIAYRAVGATQKFSDGEQGVLPVLSRRIFVRESLPLWISGKGEKQFKFKKLLKSPDSKTLVHKGLTVQMTSNPAWYAIQALPYLMEFPYECSEQVFNRLYANGLARKIANSDPKVRRIFDLWKGSDALRSNLEKNEDLKSVLLRESPWVRQAKNETRAKHRIGLLFENNRMDRELKRAYSKLKEMQLKDGSWPWFPGGRGNRYITLYIVTGFGRLKHLGVDEIPRDLTDRAIQYLDNWILEVYQYIVSRKQLKSNNLTSMAALYLYGRSYYLSEKSVPARCKKAVDYFLHQAREYWLKLNSRQNQAQLALALNRFGFSENAKKIMRSIRERSQLDEEMGRFWSEMEYSWWWFRAPIETQAVMIEAFDEVMNDFQTVEECKVWLLKQKQTRDWKTTKATADAVYALILRGQDLLTSDTLVEVRLGGQKVEVDSVEAGTGYYEKYIDPKEILPEMGNISVIKKDKGIAWGGVHWQYMEDISKITPHAQNPLKLKKRLFVRKYTKKGPVIKPVEEPLQVGDLLVVRIELRVDRDMEYVHMKDHRASGLDPVNVLSRYKYQEGLAYYESTKDTASHFFIDYLPRGTYVFEYSLRVVHKGSFQNGMAHIECMYAPEFNSHSDSVQLQVK